MEYILEILRQNRGESRNYLQRFAYTPVSETDNLAFALNALNERQPLTDTEGNPCRSIDWECSCLQKKCGACAMVVQGRPRLACDVLLSEFKKGVIRVEPLKKFPVISDLHVDRSILLENLKTLKLYLTAKADLADEDQELAYEASECIQCGCCLEVCPNFCAGGKFFGMASVPVTVRLLCELPAEEYREIAKLYSRHTFAGCGKSLACKDICPRGIDTEKLLVNANALAIWKRKRRKNGKK